MDDNNSTHDEDELKEIREKMKSLESEFKELVSEIKNSTPEELGATNQEEALKINHFLDSEINELDKHMQDINSTVSDIDEYDQKNKS